MSLIVNGVSHTCSPKGKCSFGCCYCSQFSPYFTAIKKRSAERMISPRGGMARQSSDSVPSFVYQTVVKTLSVQRWWPGAESSRVHGAVDENLRIQESLAVST